MENGFNILVADDEINYCEILSDLLSAEKKYNVLLATNHEETIKRVINFNVDLVILDKRFPTDVQGMETFKRIKEIKPDVEIIMLTAYPDSNSNHEAHMKGVSAYLIKTDDYEQLLETINKLCEKIQLRSQNALLMKELKKENQKLEKVRFTLKNWNENLIHRLKEYEMGFKKNIEIIRSCDSPMIPTKFLAFCMNNEINGFIQIQKEILDEYRDIDGDFCNSAFLRLSQITEYIYDISKVYCDLILEKPFEKRLFDLSDSLNKVFGVAQLFARSKNISLEVENFNLPPFSGNSQLISRAVLNLFKFISETIGDCIERKIKFKAYIEGLFLKIEMMNSLSGISSELIKEKFETKEFSEDNKEEIFLLIVKQAVEYHGGKMDLKISDDEENLIFTITFSQ